MRGIASLLGRFHVMGLDAVCIALTTSLMVLRPEGGYAVAERETLAVIFILGEHDVFMIKASTLFARHSDRERA